MSQFPPEKILLRTLVGNMPHCIYAKDRACRFTFANKAVAIGMGASAPTDLIGRTDFDFYQREAAQQYFDEEQQIMHTRVPMVNKEEYVHYKLTNTDAWMLTTKVPLLDEEDRVIGIAGINYDITDRKLADQALREAKLQAERASQARDSFLATMSHELRTPLNAVLGYAQVLLADPGLSEHHMAGLKTIEASGQHLLFLVNDVLDMATIEAGGLRLIAEDVNLRELVQTVGQVVYVKAAAKQLRFGCTMDPDLPAIASVDGRRLNQVLLNLASNAVKFTDKGEVSLRVIRAASLPHGVRIRFEVEDSGVGIGADELQRIFHPFEQAGDTRRWSQGAGLGLAISGELVRAMGSSIQVSSHLGVGSLFSFELDLPTVTAATAESPREPSLNVEEVSGVTLPADTMETLMSYAKSGNMREITALSTQLHAMGEPYHGLAQTLKTLAAGFESKAIMELALSLRRNAQPVESERRDPVPAQRPA